MDFSPDVKKIKGLPHAIQPPKAQIAVYDSPLAPPHVSTFEAGTIKDFLNVLSVKTYEAVKGLGGSVPFIVIREIIENLIHADFKEPVISVLEGGRKICISDQGRGIMDKEKALQPGFSTARGWQKSYIRGVGSGLPVVREILMASGGKICIEDNLMSGTVITLWLDARAENTLHVPPAVSGRHESGGGIETLSLELVKALQGTVKDAHALEPVSFTGPLSRSLSDREKKTLIVLAELGQAGPSQLAKELQMSIPTAHRELDFLEKYGLAKKARGGKRTLTEKGTKVLEKVFNGEETP